MSGVQAWREVFGDGVVVLDGGMSTQLERRGQDISGALWTGRALLDDPAVVEQAHRDFVEAGAGAVITASYQISRRGFVAQGLGAKDADDAINQATATARRAVAGSGARVVASVGPYGAILHDGSEYRGNYDVSHDELVDFHAERLVAIRDSQPDFLAIETIPDAREAEAIVEALSEVGRAGIDVKAWMTFTCKDDERTCAGQLIDEAVLIATAHPSIVAVGVNCTDPRYVSGLIDRITRVTDLPIVVYANAGGTWDAQTGEWTGSYAHVADLAPEWVERGATAVGGCCGTDAEDIRLLAQRLR